MTTSAPMQYTIFFRDGRELTVQAEKYDGAGEWAVFSDAGFEACRVFLGDVRAIARKDAVTSTRTLKTV